MAADLPAELRVTAELRRRVGYKGAHYVIVLDEAAGQAGRYTVYRLPSSPSRRVRVIGRELPIGVARHITKQHMREHR